MNTTNKTAVEEFAQVFEWIKLNCKDEIIAGFDINHIDSRFEQALTQAHQQGEREALRNVPVGFVRQWINEDLLKDGHRLVTNEDIQRFINIALPDKE